MDMAILNQGNTWTDKEGVEHPIEDMSGRYALNVYNYLLSKAQVIGFRYGLFLASMNLPDSDTVAYDHVMDDIDREHHKIGENPRAWLKDKPLMRALIARVAIDRITREQAGYVPATEPNSPLSFPPYVAPEFMRKPYGFDLDEERFGQRPGDETRVFVVNNSDYNDTSIVAVFVGNRLAAYRYEGEYNRYNCCDVTEWDDNAAGGTHGMYAQIRKYRDPWTQLSYRTSVDLETGNVTTDWPIKVSVRNDVDPGFTTEKDADGGRGRFNAVITTAGPESQAEQLRHLHAANVNTIRANVLDDLTKDQP